MMKTVTNDLSGKELVVQRNQIRATTPAYCQTANLRPNSPAQPAAAPPTSQIYRRRHCHTSSEQTERDLAAGKWLTQAPGHKLPVVLTLSMPIVGQSCEEMTTNAAPTHNPRASLASC